MSVESHVWRKTVGSGRLHRSNPGSGGPRGVFVATVVAALLVLAGCSGPDSQLVTTDSDPTVEQDRGRDDSVEIEVGEPDSSTTDPAEEDGDDEAFPVPNPQDLPEPPDPPPLSSAERQQQQELALPGFDPQTNSFERLPLPEEDRDDVSNPANATPTPVPADPFDPSIPLVTIPANPRQESPAADDSAPAQPFDTTQFALPDAAPADPTFSEPVDDSLFDEVPTVEPLPSNETEAVQTGAAESDGTENVEGFDETTLEDSVVELAGADGDIDSEPTVYDCEERAWAQGCPIPEGIFERTEDDILADGDQASDGDQDGIEEGVQVPQEVIDALLAPLDNDDDA